MQTITNGLLFLVLVSLVSWFFLPARFRWAALLTASLSVYGLFSLPYVVTLALCIGLNYVIARAISAHSPRSKQRRAYLWAGIFLNLANLFVFKYLSATLGALSPFLALPADYALLNIALPIGISFYTFRGMSYLLDAHRGIIVPEKHPGIFAAYMAFFPQIMAGPIERASTLMGQIKDPAGFDESRAVEGLRLILWGVFKKLVIADWLAAYVNTVYDSPTAFTGLPVIIATLLFAIQIYADFSGYSDLSNGVSKLLGFAGMDNFRRPYFATSVREFWLRWHISLSGWVRDYVFFPLARSLSRLTHGKHPRLIQLTVNLITMTLVGAWHGANVTFVIWGLIHGVYTTLESWIRPPATRAARPAHWLGVGARMALTFALVCLAWVFFRARTPADGLTILTRMVIFSAGDPLLPSALAPFGDSASFKASIALAVIVILALVEALDARWGLSQLLGRMPRLARWLIYFVLQMGIVVLGIGGKLSASQGFIYAQF